MSFEQRTIVEKNVVVCVLKQPRAGKAIPKSVQIDRDYEAHNSEMNFLNELDFPGRPAVFWINRGYEVYSSLTDDRNWFQICLSNKSLEDKKIDLDEYGELFIEHVEPLMCTEVNCHAYLTFDECEHTLPDELHYTLYDYL
ncbi:MULTISPECIES: hypothetical protein [unclassified Pseudoalteromonas]|uniref:hypothetical protein n=1 Tax=unclassified Pseudoalteromonas TaxID=194690 RepID=UPI0020C09F81|nr:MULTISPECIES: hypothetical protein [unclassified Pseudoalteromonas]MCK8135484.1 hypothetical protein [Pseudoalteromonas sp. 2CM28B]MDC9565213.1 hypothetical protein [Pseudoalteromonas sp. GAB2316C]MDC9569566.1 hypothetical protein [Pseudoalteromonas sp. GABNB9D]MDC9573765.1 hypothetical protein [Pseudoalteromonas sp. GABNS16A]MDC9578037.1 hypothetical protein [Pseudoalteromonas sp. GABNS16E]